MPLVGNDAQRVYCLQGNGIDRADTAGCNGRGWREDVSYTINTIDRPAVCSAGFKFGNSEKARSIGYQEECSPTLSGGEGGNQKPCIVCGNPWDTQSQRVFCGDGAWHSLAANESGGQSRDAYCYDARGNGDGNLCPTLTGDHQNRVTDYTALCIGGDVANTLDASCYKGCGERAYTEREVVCAVDCRNGTESPEVNGTLQAKGNSGISLNLNNVYRCGSTVRRLTPLECERLQGFPDGWTDIGEYTDSKGKKRKASDGARYKALGNSIALPFWFWMLRRIAAQYERPATLGSLFDGIGGFPLCCERCNGPGTAVWASEIEEFCIAVTKRRFG